MAAAGVACVLMLLMVASAAPQTTQLSGGGGEGGGGVVVKDILAKVLEAIQLRNIKNIAFCDANSVSEKPPYTCLAKKTPANTCDAPIKAGDTPAFCQDDCPQFFKEEEVANLYICHKTIRK